MAVLLPQAVNAEFVLIKEDVIHIDALEEIGSSYYLKACDNSIISIHDGDSLSFDVDAVCDDNEGNTYKAPVLEAPTAGANDPYIAPALMAPVVNGDDRSVAPASVTPNGDMDSFFVPKSEDR